MRAAPIWYSLTTGKVVRENDSVEKPFFLAGGVRPDNITEAVRRCSPYGVDLSSAVETEGRKDRRKILAAVAAVRSAGR